MTDLDLHSVRIVRAIAEHGTISGAARALGYSQPAISQHLRRAESRLGVPSSSVRAAGCDSPSPEQVLARHAIASRQRWTRRTANSPSSWASAPEPCMSRRSPPRPRPSSRDSCGGSATPARHLGDLRRSRGPEALGMLRDGLVDVAITSAYPGDRADPHRENQGTFDTVPLFTEPVVLALPSSHRLAARPRRPRPARGTPAGSPDAPSAAATCSRPARRSGSSRASNSRPTTPSPS